ncbi:MAG TPA: hypothetical protein VKO84_02135 [Gaiellaceae bacterium]|nr:hypothetical protein [Gaiellaceae bacterium]
MRHTAAPVVQRLGDGIMSRFPSALAAAQAAVAVQQELALEVARSSRAAVL